MATSSRRWPSTHTREAITANLDEIAVYPYALSASRVSAHFAASGRGGTIPNDPPNASFTSSTPQPLSASFDASTSSDSDGSITAYNWTFGDGATGTGVTPQHTYASAGSYTVRLTVTDNRGDTGTVTHTVTVTDSPPPPPGQYASDTFARTVANGFGTADVGGAWSLVGTASSFSVGGGVGRIAGAVSTSRAAYLSAVRQTDIDLESDVALDQPATGGGVYVSFIGRRTSNGNDYLLQAPLPSRRIGRGVPGPSRRRYRDGARLDDGSGPHRESRRSAPRPFPGERNDDDDAAREGVEIRHGRAGDWLLTTTDATPAALQGAGDLGVLVYVSGSWTGTLPAISLDNLDVVTPD